MMQGGYGGGKPAPAPIFNHRKRPRQAMFADQTSPSETLPTNRGPELMPVGGFPGNQNHRQGQYRPQGQKRSYTAQQTYTNQGMTGNSTQNRPGNSLSNIKKVASNGNWGQQNQMRNNQTTDYGNRGNNHTVGYNNNQNQPRNQGNRPQPTNTQGNRNNRHANSTQHNYQGSGFGSKSQYTGACGAPLMGDQLPAAPAGSMFNQVAYGGNSRGDAQSFDQSLGRDSASRNSKQPPPKKSTDKNSEKPTLRVLTANLDTVLKSTAVSDQLGPHMFEVFGVLDTAVVSDKSGTGREFVLRDETASINCVFYEIDRNLARLIRGQWQRCVGSLDGRCGRLKCVSVRGVRGEERQLAREGQRLTHQVLSGLGRMTHEQ